MNFQSGKSITLAFALLCAIIAPATAQPPRAPIVRIDRLEANGARPAKQILDKLEAMYGWQITYEDAPLEHPGDLIDATDPNVRKANPGMRGFIMGRSIPIEVALDIQAPKSTPERELVIQRLIDAHIRSRNPGILRWRKIGDVVDVYPAMIRSTSGAYKKLDSVLDTRITFPRQQRNCMETVFLIIRETSRVSGRNVALGTIPTNALRQSDCDQGANDETARSGLIQAFDNVRAWRKANEITPIKLTWRLLFQPGENSYYFNAHIVTIQRPDPFVRGKVIREPIQ